MCVCVCVCVCVRLFLFAGLLACSMSCWFVRLVGVCFNCLAVDLRG